MALIKLNTVASEMFHLWGILSSYQGHRLCWQINQKLGVNLVRCEDVALIRRPEADDAYFNYYSYPDEENSLLTELIRNKCNGEFYMRELRNFDYLLMVKGELDFFEAGPFIEKIKQVEGIRSIMAIDLDKIKHHEHLILE